MDILDCVTITPELVDSFATLIPSSLLDALRAEKVMGLGSMLADMPNGALIFRLEDHSAHILSLYVDQYDRRNGTGRFLIKKLRAVLRAVPGIFSIRAALSEDDADTSMFFEAMDSRFETAENVTARFTLSALEDSPLRSLPTSSHCIPGAKLGREELSYFQHLMEKDGTYLMAGNLWEPPVCQDHSWYYIKDKKIQGCVIMTKQQTGLSLSFMVNFGSALVLPSLLSSLFASVSEAFPPETEISLEAISPETRKLLDTFIPSAVKSSRRVAVLTV